MRLKKFFLGLVILLSAALFFGCRTAAYYRQAIGGQMKILAEKKPIRGIIADPATTTSLRGQLQTILEIRAFAETNLQLEVDGQYGRYVELNRPYVVWNVHAAPEFSLEPKKWWYPFVGTQKYRGFFSQKMATNYAASLRKKGYDVYVGGVDAYSTLGFFRDPVLSTFVYHSKTELAELLFHELSHQRVFAKGDTDFNEAFATASSEEGVQRWLKAHGDTTGLSNYVAWIQRRDQFARRVMQTRERLDKIYQQGRAAHTSAEELRSEKKREIERLRTDYEQLKAQWGVARWDYDRWFARPLNNAQLNTASTYYDLVPEFRALLRRSSGDLEKFFAEAKHLAKLGKKERRAQLDLIARGTP